MLLTVAKFLDPWEAYVVQTRLAVDGIPATVAFANHAIVNWPISLALGGVPVQAPQTLWYKQGNSFKIIRLEPWKTN
jgi:hypothetical protein